MEAADTTHLGCPGVCRGPDVWQMFFVLHIDEFEQSTPSVCGFESSVQEGSIAFLVFEYSEKSDLKKKKNKHI